MNQEKIKFIIEAALMVSEKPLSVAHLATLFEKDVEQVDHAVIRNVLEELQEDYKDRGIELREVASGYRIQVQSKYADWVNRLFDERPPRYSRALLETLAIIAYRQPLTRAEIEDIRGVSVNSSIIKTLMEREWIRVVGHRNVPGKPELLATTKEFLDYFNLKKLSDLPSLAEIKELNQINPDLFESLEISRTGDEDISDNKNQFALDADTVDTETDSGNLIIPDDNKVVPFTH
ncbi:MAG: SMC-Scp complex subunit ScpB [Gammaproteobacteria bacterium]|nr:SMC-Scp complex subunit ScpB [Gammaproteobacteria bacterium]